MLSQILNKLDLALRQDDYEEFQWSLRALTEWYGISAKRDRDSNIRSLAYVFRDLQGVRRMPVFALARHGAQLTPSGEIDERFPWSAIHAWVDLYPIAKQG